MFRPALVVSTLLVAAHAAAADPAIPADLAVYGDGGLRLGDTVLFDKPVSGAAYDPQQDLIWFLSKGTLEVIDLRDAAHQPVVIAKKVPTDGFSVTGFSNASYDADYTGVFTHLDLEKKKPTARGEEGAYAGVDSESDDKLKKQAKKVSIVGTKWLAAQRGRSATPAPAAREAAPAIELPAGVGQCEDESECGAATWLGSSPYQLVVINHSCGDACHLACMLYDPAKKQWAAPLTAGSWGALTADASPGGCQGIDVEPGNTRYAGGNQLCTLGAKMTCTELTGWSELAWIAAPAAH